MKNSKINNNKNKINNKEEKSDKKVNIDITYIKNIMAQVLENSYSPYSKFKVGAILFTKTGKMYTGVNIENMGIQSICAERCAFSKAISSGVKKNDYSHIIICGINRKRRNTRYNTMWLLQTVYARIC